MKLTSMDKRSIIVVTAFSLAFVIIFSAIAFLFTSGDDTEKEPVMETEKAVNVDEMNGLWIATVMNINFPSAPDLSKEALMREIDSIVETTRDAGLDTIFFQVRPSGDAMYASKIFPVSRYLSTTGTAQLDCLKYIIEKASAFGIGVHAWINPLRISVSGDIEDLHVDHPVRKEPSLAVKYADGRLYLDCGLPEARKLVADGIREIAENYDVAGIVFDDYFYPYPYYETDESGKKALAEFGDNSSFEKYGKDFEDKGDWRRENVNKLIELSYNTVKSANAECVFGVAPFGIWKNGYGDESGSETLGSQSYFDIFCDTLAWAEGGYVDYIAPQIYWTDAENRSSYSVLCDWWAKMLKDTGVGFFITHGAYRYEDWDSPEGIMTAQVEYAKEKENYKGSFFYGYETIFLNAYGIRDELKALYGNK